MFDTDIVVVGAGVAGIAAATALRAARIDCVVLEAGGRVGGRARTGMLAGAAFDHGAAWLHHGQTNPLTALARKAGREIVDFTATRCERLRVGDHWAGSAELQEVERCEARLMRVLADRAGREPDLSLAEAAAKLASDRWVASLLMWEGAIIAAADADRLSLRDWQANLLSGHNLCLRDGIGDFVVAGLAPAAGEIRLGHAVRRISRTGGAVVVAGDWGSLRARAVIVTVSTGVLASGAIRFEPELPVATGEAIAHLPMGLLSKVGLAAGGGERGRLGLPNSCSVWRRRDVGDPALVLLAWPLGRPHVCGHFGGRTAWEHTDPRAAEALVRAELADLFGADAAARLDGPVVATNWGTDPLFRGAYAYAEPGWSGARAQLAAPIDGGRLMFAGEACHDTLAGTVGGAWESGLAAAGQVAALITQPA